MPTFRAADLLQETASKRVPRCLRVDWSRVPKPLLHVVDMCATYRTDKVRVDPTRKAELRGMVLLAILDMWNQAHHQGRGELVRDLFGGDYRPPDPGFSDKLHDARVEMHDDLKKIAERLV